jgi:hypothetical protein
METTVNYDNGARRSVTFSDLGSVETISQHEFGRPLDEAHHTIMVQLSDVLDTFEPPTATVTFVGALDTELVTFAGVAFTAVNGSPDPAAQEFDISGDDDDTAASFVAAFNHAASQALITTALGGGLTVAAAAVANVVTLTADSADGDFITNGTLTSTNGVREALSGAAMGPAEDVALGTMKVEVASEFGGWWTYQDHISAKTAVASNEAVIIDRGIWTALRLTFTGVGENAKVHMLTYAGRR